MSDRNVFIGIRKELENINANLKCLCSIIKDSKETYKTDEIVVNNDNLCDHCINYLPTDDGFCAHGDACHRLVHHFMANSSRNSSL